MMPDQDALEAQLEQIDAVSLQKTPNLHFWLNAAFRVSITPLSVPLGGRRVRCNQLQPRGRQAGRLAVVGARMSGGRALFGWLGQGNQIAVGVVNLSDLSKDTALEIRQLDAPSAEQGLGVRQVRDGDRHPAVARAGASEKAGYQLLVRQGKFSTNRVVLISGQACIWLRSYLTGIRPDWIKARRSRALLLNRFGDPMHPLADGQIVSKAKRKAGLEKAVSPHAIRRNCATHMVQAGAPLRLVHELLGHNFI